MKAVTVSLDYARSAYSPTTARHDSPLALPLRVLDADGSLLAEGVASTTTPARIELPSFEGPAFVRLTWPSGKTQTRRVDVTEGVDAQVRFDDVSLVPNEWSAWAVPRLGEKTMLAQPGTASGPGIDRFDKVWLRMWSFANGAWSPSRVDPATTYHNDLARQLDFELDARCWLLQLGGMQLPWRFVALPGGGPCRVLLTPNESTDPRADPLKAVVTGYRRDAEALLEFLSRDAMRSANSLGGYQPVAQRLLAEKMEDPVSAVAGAYFLLRTDGWRSIPDRWFDNLNNSFPWLADPAVIRCAVMVRRGWSAGGSESEALGLLEATLQRGLPVFAEGATLLQEMASVLHSARRATRHAVFERVERLAAAQAWAGSVLSFYGETPLDASPDKLVGLPGRGRPQEKGEPAEARAAPAAMPAGKGAPPGDDFIFLRALGRPPAAPPEPAPQRYDYDITPTPGVGVAAIDEFMRKLWADLRRPRSVARQAAEAGFDVVSLSVVVVAAAPLVNKMVLDLWKFVALPRIRERWGIQERKAPAGAAARKRAARKDAS